MDRSVSFFKDILFTPSGDRDSKRLVLSGVPVFFFLCFSAFSMSAASRQFSILAPSPVQELLQKNHEPRIDPVLVEQDYKPRPETDQVRALSDVTAQGTGALTLNPGFHTLTPFDRMDLSSQGQAAAASNPRPKTEGEGPSQNTAAQGTASSQGNAGNDAMFRIPQNYRFQSDFALRYDGSSQLSIARQELAGFRYFQKMLRQIEETFSPPGMNYSYYDVAGRVTSEPIRPGVVQVQFLLDPEGNVRDVKRITSMGQAAVDEACMNALRGQNFGVPPPEVFSQGPIFGINFIFPPMH